MNEFNEVTKGVLRVPVGIANAYIVGTRDAWVLVDAGTENNENRIIRASEEYFGDVTRPELIVLTHGHFDHAGSAAALADHWDVPILAHPLEMPFVDGRSAYPPPDPTVGGFMSQVVRFIPNKQIDLGDRVEQLSPDDQLPGMEDWEIIETPGHTPGHLSFFRPEDRTLIAGDAFTTVNQDSMIAMLTRKPEVWRPPAYYTCDWDEAETSVRRLASLRPTVLAAGHGEPMAGDNATEQLRALAKNFPVPAHGRYVGRPAETDESGIVGLPPPATDPVKWTAAAVATAALATAGAMMFRKRKRSDWEDVERAA